MQRKMPQENDILWLLFLQQHLQRIHSHIKQLDTFQMMTQWTTGVDFDELMILEIHGF